MPLPQVALLRYKQMHSHGLAQLSAALSLELGWSLQVDVPLVHGIEQVKA